MDQVTPVLPALATVAVNCWVQAAYSTAVVGATETLTGTGNRLIVAAAVWLLFAWLVAVTVSVCGAAMVAGAV